jgi:hypothetical protein
MDSLSHPEKLFRVGWDLPFVLGTVMAFFIGGMVVTVLVLGPAFNAMVQIVSISLLLDDFGGGKFLAGSLLTLSPLALMMILLIPFIGLSYIIAGTLGLQIQRDAVADLAASHSQYFSYLRLWLPATLMTLGLEFGFMITPIAALSPILEFTGTLAIDAVLMLALMMGTTFLTWLGLCYARFCAQCVLGSHIGVSPPTLKRRLLTLAFVILLWIFYIPLIFGRQIILLGSDESGFFLRIVIISLIVGGGFYIIVFGVTWLLIRILRMVRPQRCPICHQIVDYDCWVGEKCLDCNYDLTAWLFSDSN